MYKKSLWKYLLVNDISRTMNTGDVSYTNDIAFNIIRSWLTLRQAKTGAILCGQNYLIYSKISTQKWPDVSSRSLSDE